MKAELDALHHAVLDATEAAIAAGCVLEEARDVERTASAQRQNAEVARDAAVARLTEARAALDARLGITPVLVVRPPHVVVNAPSWPAGEPGPHPARVVASTWEDDDEPVR